MKMKNFLSVLGPGLLYAGAAIGVSHLVQSTRAGAGFGFDLIWVLLLVNFLKYPFFEFAPRYASATNESLIHGYGRLGKWAVIAFALLTLATMFSIQAAVTIVTAGLVANVLHLNTDPVLLSALILLSTMIILIIGKFAVLDKLIKLVIVILAISTILAVAYALDSGFHPQKDYIHHFDWMNRPDIIFLIAFIGWMPAPVDVAVWSSLWNIEKRKSLNFKPSLKQSLLDFRIGYIGTAFLALCFLLLGALVMHGSGEELSDKGAVFAGQLISLYTDSIGSWARPLIAIAALTTMFSTTLTCIDAYPRVLQPTTELLLPTLRRHKLNLYWFWITIVSLGALILLHYFTASMKTMVDLATTLSFITAPALAYMNLRVVLAPHVAQKYRPGPWLQLWAVVGIIFLTLFTLFYIAWRLGVVQI